MFRVYYVNDIGEIVDKVLVDGRVGSVHAENVLVARFEGLEMSVVVFGLSFGDLLFNQFEFLRLFQLFAGDRRLQFLALRLDVAQLRIGLPLLQLVHLRRLHGRVQFVQHLQQLFVTLVSHFAALKTPQTKHFYVLLMAS